MTGQNKEIKIYTEGTPNPNALKFVLDRILIENGTYDFPNKESTKNSPLAEKLFNIEFVKEVFIGKNFITITKNPDMSWENIYDKLCTAIESHLVSGKPVVLNVNVSEDRIRSNTEQKILDILDNQIRPAIASDGGDVIFDSYEDGILRLHLQGACSSCPSSIMTLKAGIETMLKRQIPELKEVISV
ncbi:MAG: NifU family protein [Candidatus Melainabacteria bacterium]|nr:NifU family protein [Candidatus Melainabacteria bacterium]